MDKQLNEDKSATNRYHKETYISKVRTKEFLLMKIILITTRVSHRFWAPGEHTIFTRCKNNMFLDAWYLWWGLEESSLNNTKKYCLVFKCQFLQWKPREPKTEDNVTDFDWTLWEGRGETESGKLKRDV